MFDAEQRARIEINPMRAFDWDDPEIVAVTDSAPKMVDRLSPADAEHFEEVRRLLDGAAIDYVLDPRLVRGLDYYTRTVFEFRCDVLGAQSGIGGGGRYDRLIEQLGGPPTPGGGLGDRPGADRAGAGVRRRANRPQRRAAARGRPDFFFIVSEPRARERVFRVISELREEGIGATIDLGARVAEVTDAPGRAPRRAMGGDRRPRGVGARGRRRARHAPPRPGRGVRSHICDEELMSRAA